MSELRFPELFWQRVREEAAVLAPGPPKQLRGTLTKLVEGFATPGKEGRYLGDRRSLAAYLLAFLPYEVEKIGYALSQAGESWRRDRPGLSIADCGAGPGSATLGIVAGLAHLSIPISATLCDREKLALGVGRRLVAELAATEHLPIDVQIHAGLFPTSGAFDLIVVQNALSEAFSGPEAAADALAAPVTMLRDTGVLVLLEPADRSRSRFLLAVRDRLLARGGLWVLAPCTRQGSCPALAGQRQWCTMEQAAALPRAQRLGLREGFLDRDALKMSYLVMSRVAVREDPDLYRVVSQIRHGKGLAEGYLCGPAGRLKTRLLKSRKSVTNRKFLRLGRGELARVRGVETRGDALALTEESVVEDVPGLLHLG